MDKNGIERKYYKYKCNKCTFDCGKHYSTKYKQYKDELWIEESNLGQQKGCACCYNKIVVEGINDIPTTNPEMIKYFKDGYEEARKYNYCSNEKIYPICPDCGEIKIDEINIYNIYFNRSIGCLCSDSIPYSEKFMHLFLEQLGIDFQTQLSKTTFKWCQKYRYDFSFVVNSEQYIMETHGNQHYVDAWNKLEKTQLNDKLKKELALKNGVKEENYIVIDCRKSTLEWVRDNKNGILNSRLAELFDLSNINWLKCNEYACTNLVKIACEHKNNNPELNCNDIGLIMGYTHGTITKWLKQGDGIWCHYNSKTEQNKGLNVGRENKQKPVEIFKDGISLGIFKSAKNIEKQSEKLFRTKLWNSAISKVCNNRQHNHKGFIFKFV